MKDYSRDRTFVAEYREAALGIARRKMAEVEEGRRKQPTLVPLGPRLATGGGFGGFFLWDSVFGVMWARHAGIDEFPVFSTLDNFYRMQQPDGFIGREYSARGGVCWSPEHPISLNPPILSWAEITLFREGFSGIERLREVYPRLVRFHASVDAHFKRADGLYFGDALGCGMDDLPRWPHGMTLEERAAGGIQLTEKTVGEDLKWYWDGGLKNIARNYCWNRQAGWVDISSQMAFDALNLAEIADALGLAGESAAFIAEHARIAALVNEKCWCEETGFYHDFTESGIIPRLHAGAFWVLPAKIPSPERAERFVSVLKDERHFNRPVPLPTLSASDPDYDPENGYWRGSVWPSTNYAAIAGLRAYGFEAEAEDIARRWYNACANLYVNTGTVWENISPEQCDRNKNVSMKDFCGWGALAPVAIPAEFGF